MFTEGPWTAVPLERQGAEHDNRQLLLGLRVHGAAGRAAGRAGRSTSSVRLLHAHGGARHAPHAGRRAPQLRRRRHLACRPRLHAREYC